MSGTQDRAGGENESLVAQLRSAEAWRGKKLGRYELRSVIGEDRAGRVFLARDAILQRDVELKVITGAVGDAHVTDHLRQFLREAQASARLQHPNVLGVFDVVHYSGVVGVAMEHVAGRSLLDVLKGEGKLSYREIFSIGAQTAAGLACAHENGMVHGDLQPAAILLTEEGQCKVRDFGASLVKAQEDGAVGESREGSSAFFAAPEIIRGRKPRPESDIYALGVVLWLMITGRPPFFAKTGRELSHKHLKEPVPDIAAVRADVPAGLARLIGRCLAKEPRDRIRDCAALAKTLRSLATEAAAYEGSEIALVSSVVAGKKTGERTREPRKVNKNDGDGVPEPGTRGDEPAGRKVNRKLIAIAAGLVVLAVMASLPFILTGSGGTENAGGTGDTPGPRGAPAAGNGPAGAADSGTDTAGDGGTTAGTAVKNYDLSADAFSLNEDAPAAVSEDFLVVWINGKAETLKMRSYTEQDEQGTVTFLDGGTAVRMKGNTWKRFPIDCTIEKNTVLAFTLDAPNAGEIIGIGLDEDGDHRNSRRMFKLAGPQRLPDDQIGDYANYEPGSGEKHFKIPIGTYYRGNMIHLLLEADDDRKRGGAKADATFGGICLYDGNQPARRDDEPLLACSQTRPQQWRYITTAPAAGWESRNFDDSMWKQGTGPFGTGETAGIRPATRWSDTDIYLRTVFMVYAVPDSFSLRIFHDDDAAVYINGTLVRKFTGYTTDYMDFPVDRAGSDALREGRNVIAVHCRRGRNGQGIDVGVIPND